MGHKLSVLAGILCIAALLAACDGTNLERDNGSRLAPSPNQTSPPTPFAQVLQVSGTSSSADHLRLTLRAIKLLEKAPDEAVQLLIVLADPAGTYSYLLYPANRAGFVTDQFDLSSYPMELLVNESTEQVKLWVLALHNTNYRAAEQYGVDALAASLAIGFFNWVREGDPVDDPLAGVVSASKGMLFEWFAGIEVLGQSVTTFEAARGWDIPPASFHSPDGGLSVVYTMRNIDAQARADDLATNPATITKVAGTLPLADTPIPTITLTPTPPTYVLRVDDNFAGGINRSSWYEESNTSYTNQVVAGAYEIHLTAIEQREFGISWGSLAGAHFEDYVIEADVALLENDVVNGQMGIWFNYQDDFNFVYFGISNQGEYRAAVIFSNSNHVELADWTPHPAIRSGAATNTLRAVVRPDGRVTLSINGSEVLSYRDETFSAGGLAFFCYAESVPTTCQLKRLRVWEAE